MKWTDKGLGVEVRSEWLLLCVEVDWPYSPELINVLELLIEKS